MNKTLGRLCLITADLAFTVSIVAILTAGFARPAFAYVDPSVMTYTIQALAGVAVALSAVLGVAFRKTRKKLFKLLNIDENANKEVDPDWHRLNEDDSDMNYAIADSNEGGQKKASPKQRSNKGDAPSWLRRFVLSLITIGFCGFTLGIVAPFEIVAGSESSLIFSLTDICGVMAAFVGVLVVALSLLLSLVRGKAFTHILVILFCGGLCCYLQAMFLNTGLPAADGKLVNYWEDHLSMMVISTIVWLAILIAPTIASRINRLRSQSIVAALSVCLILVQSVGVASLFMDDGRSSAVDSLGEGPVQVTEDGLYEVSDKDNVIVFILDCFDVHLMNQMLEDDPELYQELAGFTYYRNHSGSMIPTLWAIPNLLTGEVPQQGESIRDYRAERYGEGTFLSEMANHGYSVGVYSDTLELSYLTDEEVRNDVAQYTINLHSTESFSINNKGAISALVKCALYRDMPWLLKWRFWFYTDEVNQKVVLHSDDEAPENRVYSLNDPQYYQNLTSTGLSVEDGDYKGAFRFIHLNGPHVPYSMDENAQYVGVDASTQTQQALGSFHIVQEYLNEMKELGVYDDATIIITSDHGEWTASLEPPTETIAPLLLVKRSASDQDGEMPQALSVSDSPVSQADFQGTVLSVMGIDSERYRTTYFDEYPADRPRDFYMLTSDGSYTVDLFRYVIDGDVLDMSNWHLTDDIWNVDDPQS